MCSMMNTLGIYLMFSIYFIKNMLLVLLNPIASGRSFIFSCTIVVIYHIICADNIRHDVQLHYTGANILMHYSHE